jgi:predicted HicB family RNase H-like nuclease
MRESHMKTNTPKKKSSSRMTITVDAEILDLARRMAADEGITLDEFIERLAERNLPRIMQLTPPTV